MVLINGICIDNCPEGYHRPKLLIKIGSETVRCSRCHYSCKTCDGPSDSNCTSCFPDAKLNYKGYCHPSTLVNQLITLERWYSTITVIFVILCFVILILIVYIIFGRTNDLICCIVESKRAHHNSHRKHHSSHHHSSLHHHSHRYSSAIFPYVDVPTHCGANDNRQRSASQRISSHEAREILHLSKKILSDQTSEDDL